MSDVPDDEAEAVEELYEHLASTGERPVDRSASRLLGEAEAVADDMRYCDPSVARDRAAVVVELLAEVDELGDSQAQEHLDRAEELALRLSPDDD